MNVNEPTPNTLPKGDVSSPFQIMVE